jgi:hypothetical protein
LLPAATVRTQIETGLDCHAAVNVDFQLGNRQWNYNHDHGQTEYDFRLQGRILGMTVHF